MSYISTLQSLLNDVRKSDKPISIIQGGNQYAEDLADLLNTFILDKSFLGNDGRPRQIAINSYANRNHILESGSHLVIVIQNPVYDLYRATMKELVGERSIYLNFQYDILDNQEPTFVMEKKKLVIFMDDDVELYNRKNNRALDFRVRRFKMSNNFQKEENLLMRLDEDQPCFLETLLPKDVLSYIVDKLDFASVLNLKSTNKHFYFKLLKYRIEPQITKSICATINSVYNLDTYALTRTKRCDNCKKKMLMLNEDFMGTIRAKTPENTSGLVLPEPNLGILKRINPIPSNISSNAINCIGCNMYVEYCFDCNNLRSYNSTCILCSTCTYCKADGELKDKIITMDNLMVQDCSSCDTNACEQHMEDEGWMNCPNCSMENCPKCINPEGGTCPICDT
tara:strand:+ start:13518 stop:14705 length:1188 start_codon:yes stop_codon:yes gene_type:complete